MIKERGHKIKRKKGNPKRHTNKHHIIPESRLNGKEVIVPIVNHDIYHALFSNMKPPEIVEWLNKAFWDNEYEITIEERPEASIIGIHL